MILGGDLGGTKTLLALAEVVDGVPRIIREERFDSRAYRHFNDLLAAFLKTSRGIKSACLALAGPTDGRTAQLTYLPWFLDASALETAFGIRRIRLVNDFAGAAQGLELLDPAMIAPLQPGQPVMWEPRVVLGAGTGLGVAGLVYRNGRYEVIPGEGGHVGFAPQSALEADLWRWLFDQYGRVTVEDIVSGPGLARIHRFLGGPDSTPAEVGQAALAGSDLVAARALEIWLTIYGGFAGDLSLLWLARGGVYIAGGIAAKILTRTSAQPFLTAFNAKREHRHIAETMPVHLVTEEKLGLLGALTLAARQDG